ncbi:MULTISPECIES: phosphatase PAP2 family protein [Stenotrophomonas]|uniref:phosphatase PAP2 family protein n=1 Tax=Stenotrophomonas TaxID=40323 RepID=UPI001CF4D375|nr:MULTISPECIES: phosphatase PAP2 family protein [Stenotrophomonas]MCA7022860.1 phosphatase PAP2 family protein [Stenotrophomonas acidaminiphila]MCE4075481.1 phosphatase PAP2 family protein [Stenotrophomonas acidaminiphila]
MPAAPSSPPPCALPAPGLAATRRGFLGRHLLIPLLLAVAASVVLMAGNGDQWLADQLYRWEGSRWAFKDAWWTTHVIHRGGKNLSTLAGVLVMLALLRACLDARWKALCRPLLYLLLAVGLSTGLVSLLKSMTQMDCPWDLQRYGGLRPFIGLFEARPELLGRAACFPAGHASAGYGWVALYFFALQVRPRWRWVALATAVATGLAFGFSQQLRGAHFLSHDVWSLAVSWTVAVLLYLLMFPPATASTLKEEPHA